MGVAESKEAWQRLDDKFGELECELDDAKQSSEDRSKRIDGAHRFRFPLSELSGPLRDHVQRQVDALVWRDHFQFGIILADLLAQIITPEKAWRLTLHAIGDVFRTILLKRGDVAGGAARCRSF